MSRLMLHTIIVALMLVFAVGSGCANAAKKPISTRGKTSETVDLRTAQDLDRRGKLLDAALAYNQVASRLNPPEKQDIQLHAADAMLRGNYVTQAGQLLDEIDVRGLDEQLHTRKQLLSAQMELSKGRADRALAQLNQIAITNASIEMRLKFHTLRIQAHTQSNNVLEAARERVALDGLISDSNARVENQIAAIQGLMQSPEATLIRLKSTQDPMNAWIEFALIAKATQQQPAELPQLLSDWRKRFPNHSLTNATIEKFSTREQSDMQLPQHVALLLPLQGQYAKSAEAVRDGFLAAYLDAPADGYRPSVQVYDTGANSTDIAAAYQRAVRDGAQFVIGPLDKAAVTALNESTRLSVPTLALNYTDKISTKNNLYQFGLAPEDEAAQVAERAWLDGHDRAAVLIPEGAFGERLLAAFRERWKQLGGDITLVQTYSAKDNDYSVPIKKVLAIDASEQRAAALKAVLNFKLSFTARRRQDLDFVFLGAQPRQARLIRPQLNFFQAADLPVYSTSHVFSGVVSAQADRDMDHVTFGDMPWVLPKGRINTALHDKIAKLWPQQMEGSARLYAFGVDAYNLIPNLKELLNSRTAQFEGETGTLYVDDANRVQRRLQWAEFKNGVPKLVDRVR